MAYETIIVDIEDGIATVKLNRPDAMNALNTELLGELADALTAAQANEKGALHRPHRDGKVFRRWR